MPAVRTQQAPAETLIPDTEQTSLPRVSASNRTACPFPKCLATVSKSTDLERHYITHFPEWKPYQCPWYHMCRFASQQKSNVFVHLQTTNMHFERSAEEIAVAMPVQVLPDCCKPKLPRSHRRVDGRSTKRVHKRLRSDSGSTLVTSPKPQGK